MTPIVGDEVAAGIRRRGMRRCTARQGHAHIDELSRRHLEALRHYLHSRSADLHSGKPAPIGATPMQDTHCGPTSMAPLSENHPHSWHAIHVAYARVVVLVDIRTRSLRPIIYELFSSMAGKGRHEAVRQSAALFDGGWMSPVFSWRSMSLDRRLTADKALFFQ